jgi:integrase
MDFSSMANLEVVSFSPKRCSVADGKVAWFAVNAVRAIKGMPQIFWSDGSPWREANLWLLERSLLRDVDSKTVASNATALHGYAMWLESSGVGWWDFPQLRKERCLVRYRGALIEAREAGDLAPSTTSQRMRVVIAFYRWLKNTGLLSAEWPTWEDRLVGVKLTDPFGFERTLLVGTTDLTIPNRKTKSDQLEDGVLPVTTAARDEILAFANARASREFFLILSLGFFTGMRLGTICDLKVQTILNAVPDPSAPGLYRLALGPSVSPPVATKFGVTGHAHIPEALLAELRDRAYSVERLRRESLAESRNRDLLFLTRFSNSYAQRGTDKSVAFNVEMNRLRRKAHREGVRAFRSFRFHQTRATFATQLARIAISTVGALHAVATVQDALLHRHEATALKYIRFVEKEPFKEKLSDEFTKSFLGLVKVSGGRDV